MSNEVKEEIISWVKALLIALVLIVGIQKFLVIPVLVSGGSMLPTVEDRDRVIVLRTTSIDRFDVVVFDREETGKNYIKRVIGIPGDEVKFRDGALYVNGKAYEEDYINEIEGLAGMTGSFSLKVPAGQYFMLGDNRRYSRDSRNFGVIPEESIKGEVLFRFLPFASIGKIN